MMIDVLRTCTGSRGSMPMARISAEKANRAVAAASPEAPHRCAGSGPYSVDWWALARWCRRELVRLIDGARALAVVGV